MPLTIEARAQHAKAVLENPVFEESFDMVMRAYIDASIATAPDDDAGRKHFHACIHALKEIKAVLLACVQSGEVQKINLDKRERALK